MIDQLLVAGNETTTNSISAGLLYLAENQATQTTLRQNEDLIPKFVEEILRTDGPMQVAIRYTATDVTVGGVDIPAGSQVLVGLGSANRDECKFARGESLDLDRSNAGAHLTLGSGVHACLGAELARLEMRESFRSWLRRFSHIELGQDKDSIEYLQSWAVRGPTALKLRYRVAV
jgi:cytochrome P450